MISHEHRCIFVHIPKTAGNSVNRVFRIGWQDHKDLARYRAELAPETFARYFKFAIVRNPWDRLFSDYNYQLKKSRPRDSKLFVFTASGSKRGFAEWVETALLAPTVYDAHTWGGEVSPHIHRWSPQFDWMSLDGRIAVDFVAHLERLPVDFNVVCERLGLPPTRLPHRNRRLHFHYSHYYDRTTRELVAAYYARDIEEFGYEFEESLLRVSLLWPFPAKPAVAEETAAPRVSVPVDAAPWARSWLSRAPLALAAGLALLLSAWTVSPMAAFSAEADSPPDAMATQSIHRAVAQSVFRPAPRRASESPLAKLRRVLHLAPGLSLAAEPLPAGFVGLMPSVAVEDTNATVHRVARPIAFSRGGVDPFEVQDTPRPRPRALPASWLGRR